MLKIIYDDIRKHDDRYFKNLYQKSCCDLKQRIDQLARDDRKKESLLGMDLLGRMLKTDRLDIKYNDCGKPYLYDSSLDFSISHSRGLVACAVSDVPVGIDIEQIRKINTNIITAKSEKDLILSNSITDDEKILMIHTAKEAYAKMCGRGILLVLDMQIKTNDQGIAIDGTDLIVDKINDTHIMAVVTEKRKIKTDR